MWQSDVVALLRECKDNGWDFESAWQMTIRRYPPRGPGMGQRQMTLEDDGEPTLVQFLEQACRQAWHNERPELARISTDLLDPIEGPRFSRGRSVDAVLS